MSWLGIEGHDGVVEQFRQRLSSGRLASTYLFVGPEGIGKRTFARRLAQVLLCGQSPPERMAPCGQCPSCVQVEALTHPDLLQVAKPADKSDIPVALLIGDKDHRMSQGLCHDLWLRPISGPRRVAILDDADDLNEAGANCLLKTLEEPPPGSVLILLSTALQRQLPTIRSRAQIVRFQPLDDEALVRLLLAQGHAATREDALRLARYSQGSLSRAIEWADPELWSFRAKLLGQVASVPMDGYALSRELATFVEAAGKEAPARRVRMRQVLGFVLEYQRQLLRRLSGLGSDVDVELAAVLDRGQRAWRGDEELLVEAIDRTMAALDHIERYVNQSTLIESWADALAELAARPLSGAPK